MSHSFIDITFLWRCSSLLVFPSCSRVTLANLSMSHTTETFIAICSACTSCGAWIQVIFRDETINCWYQFGNALLSSRNSSRSSLGPEAVRQKHFSDRHIFRRVLRAWRRLAQLSRNFLSEAETFSLRLNQSAISAYLPLGLQNCWASRILLQSLYSFYWSLCLAWWVPVLHLL